MRLSLRSLPLLGVLLIPAGCSSGSTPVVPLDATVTVAITDAASDDLSSFTVDVVALQLRRANGGTVGVLSDTLNVDLVTLEDISQIVNLVNVPAAIYTAANVTLDFSNARAVLVGETSAAAILDSDGFALTGQLTLPIDIGSALTLGVGAHRVLELDFDLNQSVTVNTGANEVRVEPALVMRVDRSDPKELVLGGELLGLDMTANTVEVELQTLAGAAISFLTLGVDAGTVYQIDGMPYVGAAGLAILSSVPGRTWIQAYGAINPLAARIDAAYIEAGTGTYNGGSDIVQGLITGRTGAAGGDVSLQVLGASDNAAHTSFAFNTTFTVNVSFANSTVVRRGSAVLCDADDLTIGQRVRVFGGLSGMTLDATGTSDVVRVQQTRLLGFANATPAGGILDLDLARVGLRPQTDFMWSEGGPTPTDPDAVMVTAGSLTDGLAIAAMTAVEVRGYFAPVGAAGDDFLADSVTNRDLAPSLILIADRAAGLTIDTTIGAGRLTFGITGTAALGELTLLDRGFIGSSVLPTMPSPTVTPAAALGVYSLRDRVTGAVQVFLVFADFTDALDTALGLGASIYNFGAIGTYDAMTNSMSAGIITTAID